MVWPYVTNERGNITEKFITLITSGKKRMETYSKTRVHYGRWIQHITVETEDGTPTKE
jgi:hypothetical protein